MPSHPRISLLAAVVYLPLTLIALVWAWLDGGRVPWEYDASWMNAGYPARLATSLVLGVSLGVVVVAVTPRLVERTRWARALQDELKPLVEGLPPRHVTWLALSSSIAEELFFRGAMQPALGLWLTSLIFGLVHVGPKRAFVVWGLWALLMGLLLGVIFALTGALLGCIVAHAWINHRNMHFIQRY